MFLLRAVSKRDTGSGVSLGDLTMNAVSSVASSSSALPSKFQLNAAI